MRAELGNVRADELLVFLLFPCEAADVMYKLAIRYPVCHQAAATMTVPKGGGDSHFAGHAGESW